MVELTHQCFQEQDLKTIWGFKASNTKTVETNICNWQELRESCKEEDKIKKDYYKKDRETKMLTNIRVSNTPTRATRTKED